MKQNLEVLTLFVDILEKSQNNQNLGDLHQNTINTILCIEHQIKDIYQKLEEQEKIIQNVNNRQYHQGQEQLETNTRISKNCEHIQDLEETVEIHTNYINYLERVKQEIMERIETYSKNLRNWDFLDDWYIECQYRNKQVNLEEKSFTGKWR